MISYIVASHRPDVLAANLEATLRLDGDDELVVVEDPPSIAVAYNSGQQRATQPVRCYVHSDVRILDPVRLRAELVEHCTPGVGMVGLIGSLDRCVPWWDCMRAVGSVVDARMGILDFDPGGRCGYVDGLLLATVHDVTWDESYPGFHLYDHDMCEQMIRRGLPNFCLTGGAELVVHNTAGGFDVHALDGWDAGVLRFRRKWAGV